MQLINDTMEMPGVGATYVSSGEQVRCWRHHSNLADGVPHEVLAFDIAVRDADEALILQAMELLFRRHESLRTFFREMEDEVRQCVIPYDPAVFSPFLYDLRGCEEQEAMYAEIQRIIDDHKRSMNRMEIPPLVKICIFRMAEKHIHVSLMIHHIISDLRSLNIIYDEVSNYYRQLKEGRPPQMQPLPFQLHDYAEWQRDWKKKNGDAVKRYWQKKLLCLGPCPDAEQLYRQYRLSSNLPAGETGECDGMTLDDLNGILSHGSLCSYSSHFDPGLYRQLVDFAKEHPYSIWSVMTAAVQMLFYQMGQSRILMVMPIDDRPLPRFESLIGYLTGAVYLQRQVIPDMEAGAFIRESYFDFLESATNIIYDQNELELDGAALRLHCRVFLDFVTSEATGRRPRLPGDNHIHRPLDGPGYYALKLSIQESAPGLCVFWKYNTVLYSAERIEFMARTFETILESICREPCQTIGRLPQKMTIDHC